MIKYDKNLLPDFIVGKDMTSQQILLEESESDDINHKILFFNKIATIWL